MVSDVEQRLARLEERARGAESVDDMVQKRLARLEEQLLHLTNDVSNLRGQFYILNALLLGLLATIIGAYFSLK